MDPPYVMVDPDDSYICCILKSKLYFEIVFPFSAFEYEIHYIIEICGNTNILGGLGVIHHGKMLNSPSARPTFSHGGFHLVHQVYNICFIEAPIGGANLGQNG